jgi:hypothetical protein
MSDLNHANFIESLPALFATPIQKATMSSFLWNQQDPETIIYTMRMYDIVRRLFYVKAGEEATPERIFALMNFVEDNEEVLRTFMVYVTSGKFPDLADTSVLCDLR